MQKCADFLIIGGGIIGISIARELKRVFPDHSVLLIEKEKECGSHASGRNSGVLHAGFYYTANSLKAQFTRLGNQLLTTYCEERGIGMKRCGKLVVARNRDDLAQLDELKRRAETNGVPFQMVSQKEASEIEPRVKTFERALFSPTTSSINPDELMRVMKQDALREGIAIRTETRYLRRVDGGVLTTAGTFSPNYVINAAGLYADKIAKDFGFSQNYCILPFKGIYLYSDEPLGSLRTHIYPVPNLKHPFLGVHFTLLADGRVKIGPTAIPALWREQYGWRERFNAQEFFTLLFRQCGLFISSEFDFKKLALEEISKYSKNKLIVLASELLNGVDRCHFRKWGKAGIRAQLLDIKKKKLEMDFIIEGDHRSLHVLNAVSPGLTCSLPVAQYVCNRVKEELR